MSRYECEQTLANFIYLQYLVVYVFNEIKFTYIDELCNSIGFDIHVFLPQFLFYIF